MAAAGPHMTSFGFATAPAPVLPPDRARVFFDGLFTTPRLQHPEGVAVGPDGWIWCGSENGQIMRIAPDGSRIEEVAATGGFTLGLAFDGDRALFACDLRHAAVFRLDLATRELKRFTRPGIKVPNYPVLDRAHERLLVSDSEGTAASIWAYDLRTGEGSHWHREPMVFANGMALSPEGDVLLVCETFARRITAIPIGADGTAGQADDHAVDLPGLPDGIAFDDHGVLFVGCYEPSRILRIRPGSRRAEVYIEDPTAHLLAHPTNIAFDGPVLYAANLGRWHVTRIETDTHGAALHARKDAQP